MNMDGSLILTIVSSLVSIVMGVLLTIYSNFIIYSCFIFFMYLVVPLPLCFYIAFINSPNIGILPI